MTVRITVTYEGVERILEFDTNRIAIGRPSETEKPDADLSPDSHVSRQHAVLEVRNGEFWLTDLNSRSGTQVNGREIRGQGEWRLWPEDFVQAGQTKMRVTRAGGGKPVVVAPSSQLPRPSAAAGSAASVAPTPPAAAIPASPAPAPVPPSIAGSNLPSMPSGTEMRILKMVDTGQKAPPVAAPGASPAEKRLALLLDFPRQFSAQTGVNGLFQSIMERVVEVIPAARRGALLMRDAENDQLLLKAYVANGEPAVSETLARRTLAERRAFIWTLSPSGDNSRSIYQLQIVNGMYAPLQWQDQVFGVICVDSPVAADRFSEDDLQFLIAIGRYAGMALAEQQLHASLRRSDKLIDRLLANFSPKLRAGMVERARLGKLRPGGVKSEVTILYCDLCGFTQKAAEMDAHDVVDMLNDYFQPMIDAIFREDGVVDKFVGDAVLAVFGSPEADPLQHQKAVRTALAIQQAVEATSRLRAARNDVTCQVRVGVHCGEAFHGFVGTLNRLEFTVIGDPVNRACRYCQAAGEGEILISSHVFQHVFGFVKAEKVAVQTKEGELLAHRLQELKA
ncbi:MAG TPA: adenylate/guanylate cyclase domain-containing protein [Candidatus Saccharimonadales bacterium]|nr:adenylate/guanylate cyclase domain-containing protein [Candidatus Saccharimonadales bacterium]